MWTNIPKIWIHTILTRYTQSNNKILQHPQTDFVWLVSKLNYTTLGCAGNFSRVHKTLLNPFPCCPGIVLRVVPGIFTGTRLMVEIRIWFLCVEFFFCSSIICWPFGIDRMVKVFFRLICNLGRVAMFSRFCFLAPLATKHQHKQDEWYDDPHKRKIRIFSFWLVVAPPGEHVAERSKLMRY